MMMPPSFILGHGIASTGLLRRLGCASTIGAALTPAFVAGMAPKLLGETTRKNLDTFWELIDEILNALLFVLINLTVDLLYGVLDPRIRLD